MGRTYSIHQSLTIHLFIATVIKYHLILLWYFKYNLFFCHNHCLFKEFVVLMFYIGLTTRVIHII